VIQISLRSRQAFRPHEYVNYNTFVTFYAWLSCYPFRFLSFQIIYLFTSTGQTGKPISMVEAQTMLFHPRKCLFRVSLKKFDFKGSVTPKNRLKVGVVYDFPAKLGESINTHISVKSRDIDTNFEPEVANKKYTLDFGSEVTYRPIQDSGSRQYEKIKTEITQFSSDSN
jgi:hypothetical protein